MEKYIKKYFWTINLVTIATCAFLAAKSVNTFVGSWLAGDAQASLVAPAEEPAPRASNTSTTRKATKNPFTGESMLPPEPIPENTQEASAKTPMPDNPDEYTENTDCPKSSLPGTLIGTVVSDNPGSSFALVLDSNNKAKMFEIGHEFSPSATVVAVVRHKLFINNNGRVECLFHGEAPEKKKNLKDVGKEAAEDGIRKISETEFIVSESEVARAMENLNVLATQARIVPSFQNGKSNGFRIYSIKPGSLYQKIGIKNGDILQRVNGLEIDSPEKALEVYSKLRSEKSITIDVLRRGQKTSLDYTIQ